MVRHTSLRQLALLPETSLATKSADMGFIPTHVFVLIFLFVLVLVLVLLGFVALCPPRLPSSFSLCSSCSSSSASAIERIKLGHGLNTPYVLSQPGLSRAGALWLTLSDYMRGPILIVDDDEDCIKFLT